MLNVKKTLTKVLALLLQADYRELLWTNSAPTSNFGEQTIPFNLSGYDAVDVEFSNSTSSSAGAVVRGTVGGSTLCVQNTGSPQGIRGRLFTVDPMGIKFFNATDGTAVSYNTVIPIRIWGIKLGGGVLLKGILNILTPCRKVVGVC